MIQLSLKSCNPRKDLANNQEYLRQIGIQVRIRKASKISFDSPFFDSLFLLALKYKMLFVMFVFTMQEWVGILEEGI